MFRLWVWFSQGSLAVSSRSGVSLLAGLPDHHILSDIGLLVASPDISASGSGCPLCARQKAAYRPACCIVAREQAAFSRVVVRIGRSVNATKAEAATAWANVTAEKFWDRYHRF